MSTKNKIKTYVDNHHVNYSGDTVFGFWIYLLTDSMLFATLFAVYATMAPMPTELGVMPKDLFNVSFVLWETVLLLASSFTFGLAMLSMHSDNLKKTVQWLLVTMALGLGFLAMEIYEFVHLVGEGATIQTNGYWAAFFTLVATHGLHVTAGVVWMVILFVHFKRDGLSEENRTRLSSLSLFWHFLDLIWIVVFTLVYLLGVL